jgi:hypothetical protein
MEHYALIFGGGWSMKSEIIHDALRRALASYEEELQEAKAKVKDLKDRIAKIRAELAARGGVPAMAKPKRRSRWQDIDVSSELREIKHLEVADLSWTDASQLVISALKRPLHTRILYELLKAKGVEFRVITGKPWDVLASALRRDKRRFEKTAPSTFALKHDRAAPLASPEPSTLLRGENMIAKGGG